jgi:SAM-dependent methyltransferase
MEATSEVPLVNRGGTGQATPFRCHGCGASLRVIELGNELKCVLCGWGAGDRDGTFDFVTDQAKLAEAEYYDGEYSDARPAVPPDLPSLRQLWVGNPTAPYNELMWRRMQGIAGKTVVVLGSGSSPRELHFLEQEPRWLVISDLSKMPLHALRERYTPDRPSNLAYAAIDAEQLPFADRSVDVVYGYAFVHHLPDLDAFLREVARVLVPGGTAVFLDSGYAPLWEGSKRSWLRWLMRIAHRVNPISPEDARFTEEGGFHVPELENRIARVGAIPWSERSGTLHYLAIRASMILARLNPRLFLGQRVWIEQMQGGLRYRVVWRHARLLEALHRVDCAFAKRSEVIRRNQVRLLWGFDMPADPSA